MKNVIDETGNEYPLTDGYTAEVFKELKKISKNFNEHLFILFGGNSDKTPMPIISKIENKNKILIWHGSENKRNNISKVKNTFKHIFSNYYWNTENVTSIPLGYFTETADYKSIPIKERLYDISFIGCLNRNRLKLASELTGIRINFLRIGMAFFKKTTLRLINAIVEWKWNKDLFQFNSDFNKGMNANIYQYFLQHTKIALCPRGWVNAETFRLYEAMRYGCVVITEELPDRQYYKDIPVIQIRDWEEGLRIARHLVKDAALLEKMGNENIKYYEKNLSPKACAKIIVNKLSN